MVQTEFQDKRLENPLFLRDSHRFVLFRPATLHGAHSIMEGNLLYLGLINLIINLIGNSLQSDT